MPAMVVCSHQVSRKHIGELWVQRVSPQAQNPSLASWIIAIIVSPHRACIHRPASDVCQRWHLTYGFVAS
jgi:hypothetical protein